DSAPGAHPSIRRQDHSIRLPNPVRLLTPLTTLDPNCPTPLANEPFTTERAASRPLPSPPRNTAVVPFAKSLPCWYTPVTTLPVLFTSPVAAPAVPLNKPVTALLLALNAPPTRLPVVLVIVSVIARGPPVTRPTVELMPPAMPCPADESPEPRAALVLFRPEVNSPVPSCAVPSCSIAAQMTSRVMAVCRILEDKTETETDTE
ncbi:hypothetical protein V8C86DRAFT_2625462, partial [Haematococcus lacustris]